MSYLVLARKYRSKSFAEVVGQEPIATTLANAVRTGRLAQAYLFTGTRGVGKTTVARILAKALNCLSAEGPTPQPCNKCDACEAIGRGDDMDVIEIDGASNRGIDEIRELRSNAGIQPARARFKIYYIDEVHMLTKEAFNALLKTLEEPPPHVKFIFATTEPQKIPATILSRCQRFDFRNIPTADIAAHLESICRVEQVEIDSDAIFRIAKAGAGSMRDALSLLDQLLAGTAGRLSEADVLRVLGTPPEERLAALADAIAGSDPAAALGRLDELLLAGYPLEGVAAALAEQFRLIMLVLTCGVESPLIEVSESARAPLAGLAGRFTLAAAVHALGVCEQLMRSIRAAGSPRALAEAAVVRLAAADKFVDPASLVERLEQLAAGGTASGGTAPAGAAWGAKKKPLMVPAGGSAAAGSVTPAGKPPAGQALPAVQWDAAWLAAHWPALMQRLGAAGYGAVAGLLQPARPLAAGEGTIRLGYPADQASICGRAAGAMAAAVAEALGTLAGRAVQCRVEMLGEPTGRPPVVGGHLVGGVSSEQRRQAEQDPAVRGLLDRFGGQVSRIHPDLEPARADGPPGEAAGSAEPAAGPPEEAG